jgi:hypothetical protein
MSSYMHVHTNCTYPYRFILVPSQAWNVLCLLAPVLEIETLTAESILGAQKKERFVLGVEGGRATEM